MNDLNVVSLTGRLVRDVEVKQFGDSSIGTFDIGNGYSVKKNGNWEKATNFIRCKKWKVDSLANYLKKGQMVAVVGELRQETWEKEGKKNSAIVVMVDRLVLCGGKSENNTQPEQTTSEPQPSDINEDSIPF